jgi:hypothetical protein
VQALLLPPFLAMCGPLIPPGRAAFLARFDVWRVERGGVAQAVEPMAKALKIENLLGQ